MSLIDQHNKQLKLKTSKYISIMIWFPMILEVKKDNMKRVRDVKKMRKAQKMEKIVKKI